MSTSVDRGQTLTNVAQYLGSRSSGSDSGGQATTATFVVTNQTGVQGVYGSTGSSLEQAQYSLYGKQTITSGSDVTPFGFQGSYTDPTGLVYLINRYYDPTTDQFLSIDPDVAKTDQPYVFTNDDPLNSTDPFGLCVFCVSTLKKIAKVVIVAGAVRAALSDPIEAAATYAVIKLKTVAVCGSVTGYFGAGGGGSVCAGKFGGKYGVSFTGFLGGGSPGTSVGVGVEASNARTPRESGGLFGYEGGSAGVGPVGTLEGFEGNGTNNRSVVGGYAGIGFGGSSLLPFPVPAQIYGGISDTKVFTIP
jgi:RHS repeat-associated protein